MFIIFPQAVTIGLVERLISVSFQIIAVKQNLNLAYVYNFY